MTDTRIPGRQDAAANKEVWTRINAEYADDHADRAWAAEEIAWGVFNIQDRQLGVLGDVAGLDAVELGCGTAYLSAWLARGGMRAVGVDITPAQLETARRCQRKFGPDFPLIEAGVSDVPLPDHRFDPVLSGCPGMVIASP
jgi:ubiquinone/menaquinone biosynthesis C-methylase UbiE